jgi:hypothetical protein
MWQMGQSDVVESVAGEYSVAGKGTMGMVLRVRKLWITEVGRS